MKAVIKSVKFKKEFESKFGLMYSFEVCWDDQKAYYTGKKKDQTYFVEGKEAEFSIEEKTSDKGTYKVIKPAMSGNLSGFSRNLKKEQSRYTTMGASYVKDLIIAGKVDISQWEQATEKIVKFMFNLDKEIENDNS